MPHFLLKKTGAALTSSTSPDGILSFKPTCCVPPTSKKITQRSRAATDLLSSTQQVNHCAKLPGSVPDLSHKMRFSTLLPLGFLLPPQGHMQMTVLFLKPVPMRPLHSLSSRIMTECNSVNSKSSPGRCPLTLPELGDERRQPDLRQAAGLSE